MLKDTLNADLKSAMLARDTQAVEVLKGLKSAILYAEVAAQKRDPGFTDSEVLEVLAKESKKRQDSIDLYTRGGNEEKAQAEKAEKAIIDSYLPAKLSQSETENLIDETLKELKIVSPTKQDMGRIMGEVRKKGGPNLDGALVARLVQERISKG